MSGTIVVLVNGEVLANGQGPKISDQRANAQTLAQSLYPLFLSDYKIAVLHGNKPQVGFVLFRSELASHVLHSIPLDVCGADTQGATGYILSQAIMNVIKQKGSSRRVMSVLTQTLVDDSLPRDQVPLKTIGPWFDRDKAEQYRQTRGWEMVEEPGHGYRRVVPSYPAKEILESDDIRHLVDHGAIVIAGGGGGIPVRQAANGELEGIETVIDTDHVANLLAQNLNAAVLLMVIEKDKNFILSGLSTEHSNRISLEELDHILAQEVVTSHSVNSKLKAASQFLHSGGEQVIITTLRKLPDTLANRSGLWIGAPVHALELSEVLE